MKKILLIVIILLLPLSFLLFHDKGNEYLKPYVATYLEKKLGTNMSVEVQHLKIDLQYVELVAVLNSLTELKTQGAVSLFSRTLDIDYTLKSNGIKNFDNQIDINGTAMGTFKDLKIQGEGETLKSHINYALNVKNDVVNNIKIKIKQADIASLLKLTGKAAYANGKVDIDIDIPTLKDIETKGNAKILLHKTTLNEKVFKKELQVDLPKNIILTANIDSKISAKSFEIEGNIKSNLGSLKLSQSTYELNTKKLLMNYVLNIPKLSELMFMSKQKLNGQLNLKGQLLVKDNAFVVKGKSKSFGGESIFNFNGQELTVNMKEVDIAKVLYLLGEKPYARGKLIAEIKLSDVKNLKGVFKIKTQEAKTVHYTLKKALNLDFGKPFAFTLNSEGDISSNIIRAQSSLRSDMFNYYSDDMHYKLKEKILDSTYLLDIPKLSKLNSLAGKTLKGSLKINGQINHNKTLEVVGSTQNLGGNITFSLYNQKVKANIKNVPVEKLMHLLDYPQFFKAVLVGEFKYDLKTQKGTFISKLNKAQLLSSQLTILVQELRGIDLTKERYNQTEFNALLDKNFIDINFKANSKKVLLEIPHGRINKVSNNIHASYNIIIDNKDLGGKIKGNLSNPKVTFDSSSYLQDKVMDVMQGNISHDTLKGLGLGKMEPDAMKETMKSILGGFFH